MHGNNKSVKIPKVLRFLVAYDFLGYVISTSRSCFVFDTQEVIFLNSFSQHIILLVVCLVCFCLIISRIRNCNFLGFCFSWYGEVFDNNRSARNSNVHFTAGIPCNCQKVMGFLIPFQPCQSKFGKHLKIAEKCCCKNLLKATEAFRVLL